MFSGVIEHTGTILKIEKRTGCVRWEILCPEIISSLILGASISCNGCCLTVCLIEEKSFFVEIVPETTSKTTFTAFKEGDKIHLEIPLKLESLIHGHLVQGHIDGIAYISAISRENGGCTFTFSIPEHLSRYIVEKGSIAIDGVSLTVWDVSKDSFSVALIPHTLEKTLFSLKKVGDHVNIETDLVSKYIEKLTTRYVK